jgi:hypothetical protein
MNEAVYKAARESNIRNNAIDCSLQHINDRAIFQFEPNFDDNEMENQIDHKLSRFSLLLVKGWVLICVFPDKMAAISDTLNDIAGAINQELTTQNETIGRIAEKSDMVYDGIATNQAKLDRIK